MSELEKILNDDLLKCKIVESVENPVRRVDLIKWTHDNTYSIAEVRKDTGKLEVKDLKAASGLEAYKHFYRNYGDIAICVAKTPHIIVGNHYEPFKKIELWQRKFMRSIAQTTGIHTKVANYLL